MEVLATADRPVEDADESNFDGQASLQRFLPEDRSLAGRAYRVSFEAGSRTHWHKHSDVQLLYVVEGRCLVQVADGPVLLAVAGDVVRFEPGEKHWHGASEDGPMTHLAVNLGDTTTWLEPVGEG